MKFQWVLAEIRAGYQSTHDLASSWDSHTQTQITLSECAAFSLGSKRSSRNYSPKHVYAFSDVLLPRGFAPCSHSNNVITLVCCLPWSLQGISAQCSRQTILLEMENWHFFIKKGGSPKHSFLLWEHLIHIWLPILGLTSVWKLGQVT